MALVFDESYFRGDRLDGYTDYGRAMWGGTWTFGGFAEDTLDRAASKGVSLSNRSVLVVGSGFGFMVEELLARGVNAWGLDVSEYAISQTPAAIVGRNLLGDARLRSALNAARSAAGLKGNARFDLILTEDVLPCMSSDAEALALAVELRRHAIRVGHRVSTFPSLADVGYLWHTLAEWRALLGSGDWLWDYHDWTEG